MKEKWVYYKAYASNVPHTQTQFQKDVKSNVCRFFNEDPMLLSVDNSLKWFACTAILLCAMASFFYLFDDSERKQSPIFFPLFPDVKSDLSFVLCTFSHPLVIRLLNFLLKKTTVISSMVPTHVCSLTNINARGNFSCFRSSVRCLVSFARLIWADRRDESLDRVISSPLCICCLLPPLTQVQTYILYK